MPNTSRKNFQRAYQQLNREQKEAVDAIDGPVMVIAGPGTGKTQTLALRIANILQKTDAEPDSILALTFTEAAAKEMRKRLTDLIGQSAYYINISTFHAFCTNVIRENPDFFILDLSAEPLSELERLKLFHEILDRGNFKVIRPINAPHLYTKALMSSIQNLKREGINPDEFQEILSKEKDFLSPGAAKELTKTKLRKKTRDLKKNQELLEVYRTYQEKLKSLSRYDFEDMINFVTEAFEEKENLLREYQERFLYFLIDEYQDTNSAQNQVVNLLASYWKERANLFAVGDPSQSIFRFQGASIENSLSFLENYPESTVITLKQNYRSQQTLLNAAHSLIQNNKLKIKNILETSSQLKSAKDLKKTPLKLAELPSSDSERIFLGEKIKDLIDSGTKPSEIAVIYKRNSSASEIAEILSKLGVDYTIQGGGNVLKDPTVKRLLKIFRVIRDLRCKKDDLDLFTILHYDIFSVDSLDVLKLSRAASSRRLTLFDILENDQILSELKLSSQKELEKFLTQLASWQKIDANSTFIKFFEKVLNESGYLNWLLKQEDAHHKITAINTLFSEIKRMNRSDHRLDLESFINNLDLMEQENLKISLPEFAPRDDAVVLTTAHSAKGLEWENVFLYKVIDGLWGNQRVRELIHLPQELLPHTDLDKKEKNEDERRIFYVALTRAKKQVFLTRANTYSQRGRTKEKSPSMFISEIPDNMKQKLNTKKSQAQISKHLEEILQVAPQTITSPSEEKDFLEKTLERFRLSPTSLNTYLECPYKFKLNNLLKVPKAKQSYLSFGTAVHQALENFYKQLNQTGETPIKEHLLKSYQKAIRKEILTKEELQDRIRQGEEILSAYYDFYHDKLEKSIWNEKFFSPYFGDIPLSGKVDRIEWKDKGDKTIRVVDYKTGRPKTKGQIMGTTKYSKGNLHRQLVFYKLLVDLDRRLKVDFGEAELDFVEQPKRKGKSGKKRFQITSEETQKLKKTIQKVMQEIRSLNFPRTKDYTNCSRCDFKDHCWPNGLPKN